MSSSLRVAVGIENKGVISVPFFRKNEMPNVVPYSIFHDNVIGNSWFAINLLGCGTQCQPPTPAGSDNGTNKIFLCVVPPTWPP